VLPLPPPPPTFPLVAGSILHAHAARPACWACGPAGRGEQRGALRCGTSTRTGAGGTAHEGTTALSGTTTDSLPSHAHRTTPPLSLPHAHSPAWPRTRASPHKPSWVPGSPHHRLWVNTPATLDIYAWLDFWTSSLIFLPGTAAYTRHVNTMVRAARHAVQQHICNVGHLPPQWRAAAGGQLRTPGQWLGVRPAVPLLHLSIVTPLGPLLFRAAGDAAPPGGTRAHGYGKSGTGTISGTSPPHPIVR